MQKAEGRKKRDFPAVPAGWSGERWVQELRRKADCCRADHPQRAEHYRAWAATLEGELRPDPGRRRLPEWWMEMRQRWHGSRW